MNTTLDLEPLSPSRLCGPLVADTITTYDELSRLEAAWRSLGSTTGGPIEQFDWVATCATSGQKIGDLRTVAITAEDRLVAVAPLDVQRIHGVRRRVMIGVDEHHEPMDLLAADSASRARLAQALARDGMPVVFGRLPADSPSVEALRSAFRGRAFIVTRPQAAYPYIPLDPSWETPEQQLNSGRRSDVRRAQRRAEKLGEFVVEVLTPEPDQLDSLLDEAFDVELRSWKGRAGTALSCDPADAEFCREYARAACRQGILRLCFVRIDGRAVAMQIAMVHGGGFWLLKIGYDAEFSACSPGMLLLRESIGYAAREGLDSFEFLGQAEPWIEVWTSYKRRCVALRVYPYNVRGGAALAADATVKIAGLVQKRSRQIATNTRSALKACAMPVMKLAARKYIAGDTLADAVRVKDRLAKQGLLATLGFWDTEQDSGRSVADQYLAGLAALSLDSHGTYLSLKLPSLRYSADLLGEVVQRAHETKRRIHFDAMAPETVDRTRAMIDDVLAASAGIDIGFTLPGRWQRSLDDAHWASERNLMVRVVKGEWPDPDDPQRDLRAGYLATIDQLAGRARHVSVATHDPPLAAEAVRRLQAAGTPCNLELLFGLPMRDSIRQARQMGIEVRVYVPYGEAYMPYALSQIRRKPRIVWWLAKDLVASVFRRRSE